MSDLVVNPEDRFSHNEAQIIPGFSRNWLDIDDVMTSLAPFRSSVNFLLACKLGGGGGGGNSIIL